MSAPRSIPWARLALLPTLPLERYGLEWIQPPAPLAHPLDDGTAAVLERSVEATAAGLGADAAGLSAAHGAHWSAIAERDRPRDPRRRCRPSRHPLALARFGLAALRSARALADARFPRRAGARAVRRHRGPCDAAAGAAAHRRVRRWCWRIARARRRLADGRAAARRPIADALAAYLRALGGEIVTGRCARWPTTAARPRRAARRDPAPARSRSRATGCPPATRQLRATATGPASSRSTGRSTGRSPGGAGAAPRAAPSTWAARWTRSPPSERAVWRGQDAERPFVLLAQQSLFDPTRAPGGQAHRLGVLPRAERLDGRHDGSASRRRSSASRPASATASWRGTRCTAPQTASATTRTTSAATSTAGVSRPAGSSSAPRPPGALPYATPVRALYSARPPHLRAAASTGCAATSPPRRRCTGCSTPAAPGGWAICSRSRRRPSPLKSPARVPNDRALVAS